MAYDTMESTTGAAAARTQQVMDVAQDAAERAGAYVQRQIGHISDRARDITRVLGESLEGYTGPSIRKRVLGNCANGNATKAEASADIPF